jgi:RNA polymerase sigma-70 factor (ECF subfamily)
VEVTYKRQTQLQACGPAAGSEEAKAAHTHLTEALVAAGTGDRQAFSDVYRRTSSKLFGICLSVCGERAAAEDVLHEVYVKVWKNAVAFDPSRSSPVTWLAMIARNRSIDWKRAEGCRRTTQLQEAMLIIDPSEDPETATFSNHDSRRVHALLRGLESRQLDSIKCAFFEGLTYQDVAHRMQEPLGTVKSDIRRGLLKLRADLGEIGPEARA